MANTRKIRSKHNNLFNYFIHDKRYLSKAYLRSCEKFFKELSVKQRAASIEEKATSFKLQAKKVLDSYKIPDIK